MHFTFIVFCAIPLFFVLTNVTVLERSGHVICSDILKNINCVGSKLWCNDIITSDNICSFIV